MIAEPESGPQLSGPAAFAAVARFLATGDFPSGVPAEPHLARLVLAVRTVGKGRASALDLAVLVRQALRYQDQQPHASQQARLVVPIRDGWPGQSVWDSVGVDATATSDGYAVAARPWRPHWLSDSDRRAADSAAGAAPLRRLNPVQGDPFLARFGLSTYLSAGQRAAMRAALLTPPGATLLVCLPTGEGKSLIFQAIAEVGFADAADAGPGVTLVVTPTVALAMDHAQAARDLDYDARAYVGGEVNFGANRQIADAIADGRQGLCFASPEAACGTLRRPLLQAARTGRLRALVLDEAHLVDAWGSDFRPHFQLLSGLQRDVRAAATGSVLPRTFLLSATLTQSVVGTLRVLFGPAAEDHRGFGVVAAGRLRPEIEYWIARPTSEIERRDRVREAILYLPRPAILYVTRRSHADEWFRELRELGFRRIARVTGKSTDQERLNAIAGWRDGSLDLVVGTSAFGLGINNPHVRAVVHACIPETLDRFYQEVGRGGRDGCASASVIVPAHDDFDMARGLNRRQLITVNRGFMRWKAMFRDQAKVHYYGDVVGVPMDVRPGLDERDIDMVGERNTGWNARTLTLMASAGLIELQSAGAWLNTSAARDPNADQTAPDFHPIQVLKVLEQRHLDAKVWQAAVQPRRRDSRAASESNLQAMYAYLRPDVQCRANILAPMYEVREFDQRGSPRQSGQPLIRVARACGGCPACRAAGRAPYADPPIESPEPWPAAAAVRGRPLELLQPDGRLVVFYAWRPGEPSPLLDHRVTAALGDLVWSGVHNLIIAEPAEVDLHGLRREVRDRPFFVADKLSPNHLPPGPSVLVVPPSAQLSTHRLRRRYAPDEAWFFFLPDDATDVAGQCLHDRYQGRQVDLAAFLRWMRR